MLTKPDVVLLTLMGLAQNYKAKWCYPSQEKIRELCLKIHHAEMSNRSLNRYLKLLEDTKTISRIRRLSKRHFNNGEFVPTVNPTGALRPSPRNPEDGRFKTTIYSFTGKAFNRVFLLTRKLANLFRYWRFPEWVRRKEQSQRDKAAKPSNRLPLLSDYNPLRGVSVSSSSPVKVGEVLKTMINRRLKPSEAIY